ncbi:choice-of-anchor D domain-containing protein [bacterium]|nr:choice-of-anchor D domain-containing protein [bacterium]
MIVLAAATIPSYAQTPESWNQNWVPMLTSAWGYMTDPTGDHNPGAVDVINNSVPLCSYSASSGTSMFFRIALGDNPINGKNELVQYAWMAQIDIADDGNSDIDVTVRAEGITEYLSTYNGAGAQLWTIANPVAAGFVQAYQSGSVWYLEMQVPYSRLGGITPNTPIRFFYHTSTTESNAIKDATLPTTTISGGFLEAGVTTPGGTSYGFLYDTRDTNPYSSAGTYNSGERVYLQGYGWPVSTSLNVRINNASGTQMWSGTVDTDANGDVASTASWLVDYSAASGIYTIQVQSPLDDSYNNYDQFTVNQLLEPEIQVSGNSTVIADGDTSPSTADDTDFGTIDLNTGAQEHTFTIANIGNADLTLTGDPRVAVSGAHAGDFTVTAQPATPVTSGNSVTFTVTFNPSGTGLRTATVSIANNDSDEGTYDFALQGTGALIPEIQVSGTGVIILNGDTEPTSSDETYFGDVVTVGASKTGTFRIDNLGSSDLILSGSPLISIGGVNPDDFTVTQQPSTPVSGGGYTTFEITFDPSAMGTRTALVSIANNDLDENPYTFVIEGTGISPGTPISCVSNFYHYLGSGGSFATVSTGSHPYTYSTSGSAGYAINAAGYNAEDGLIYAHERGGTIAGDNIVRIDAAGAVTVLTASVPFGADAGDCDNSGNYYFVSGSSWGKYDASTATVTSGSLSGSFAPGDMAYLGGSFYGVSGKTLYRYDPAGNSVSTSTLTGTLAADVDGSTISGTFTAAWSASDGYLYVLDAGSNRYYKVTVSSGLSFYAGSGSGGTSTTDGASCHTASSPLPNSGSIGDYVWLDFDNDGIQDSGEYGKAGVTVTLYRSTGTQVASTTSAADGSYSFSSVAPEQYYVIFSSLPANFSFASADQGGNDALDSDANVSTGQTASFICDAFESENGWDAGLVTTGVGDFVWNDLNQNGLQDAGEPGLSGVTVTLMLNNSSVVTSTTTDSNGRFLIAGVTAGTTYKLGFSNFPGGFQVTTPNAGTDITIDSDASTNKQETGTFTLTANTVNSTYDAGLIQTSSPEMHVEGNSVLISDGDTTPDTADDTDFGSVAVASGTIVKTYTIYNTGSVDLSLLGSPKVAVSGTHAAEFSVTVQPGSPIAPSGSVTFSVSFDPAGGGLREATLSITTNDPDENPYNFSIQGTGLAPEMDVSGNGVSIADGDNLPSETDHTAFGEADVASGSVVRTFVIDNTGNSDLSLTGSPMVVISGTHAGDFQVTQQPDTSKLAYDGGTLTFQVTFTPSATGVRSAAISIANDDSDENPYNFSIQGTGTSGPEMDVLGNGNEIPDDDSTPSTADHTNFGSLDVNGGTVTYTFTIENTGSDDLNLTGTPIVSLSGTHAADFTVVTQPSAAVITSGNSLTFQVRFDPSAPGVRTAEVSIDNDDFNEDPYNFSIQGTGYPYISITDETVSEDAGSVSVTVTLTGSYISGASVGYTTADSSAQDGSDYTAASGTLVWGSGESGDKTITIPLIDNGTYEPDEYIKVVLSSITNATFADSLGIVTITDDDGVQEIMVTGNGVEISSGDTSPSGADHTDFGMVNFNSGTAVRTFTIKNPGTAELSLTGSPPYVAISGSHASEFSVTAAPANSIGLGDSTTCSITFDPAAAGVRSASISIANNDADENPYTFSIQGTGYGTPILVLSKSVDKATAGPGEQLTYTIIYENIGDGDAAAINIKDPIPANTTFVAGSVTATGMTVTYSHDGGSSYNGSDAAPVTHIFCQRSSALAPGGSGSITFKVTIN